MMQGDASQYSMYCPNCDYRLLGLSENRCPECGTRFDPDDPSTVVFGDDRSRRSFEVAGRSVAWMYGCLFVLPIALALFTDSLRLDIVALIMWVSAQKVKKQSVKSTKWAIGLTALYAIGYAGELIHVIIDGKGSSLKVWLVPSKDGFLALAAVFALWASLNVWLLVRALRQPEE